MVGYTDNKYSPNWLKPHNAKVKGLGNILPSPSRSDTDIQEYKVGPKQGINTMLNTNNYGFPKSDVDGYGPSNSLYDPFGRTQTDGYATKEDQDKRSKWRAMMNQDFGIADDSNPFMPNPLKTPEFDFGFNMPTFDLAQKTGKVFGGIADTILGYKTFGLKEDLARAGMARDDRNEVRNVALTNNDVKTTNNASDRYNNFILQYGGPDGKYVKRNQINSIS